tara:strand:+ start:211 stop:366 length:156 start_codon:yes stop_codon:yes gene_type:complete
MVTKDAIGVLVISDASFVSAAPRSQSTLVESNSLNVGIEFLETLFGIFSLL